MPGCAPDRGAVESSLFSPALDSTWEGRAARTARVRGAGRTPRARRMTPARGTATVPVMPIAAAPPPMTGVPTDPPPKDVPSYAEKLDKTAVGGIAYRAWQRYSHANVGLLAAGTGYYLFLSLLSLLAVAYGITAIVGADRIANLLTEALNEALPGLIGDSGVDPEQLRTTGRTAGLIGGLVLLYSGLGAVNGAMSSMHLIYGAPPDPRQFVVKKLRQLGILLMVAPLIALSFAAASVASTLFGPVLDTLGLQSGGIRLAITVGGPLLGFGLDLLIVWILLGVLGGIRPPRMPRLVAAGIGAVAVGLVKLLLTAIVAWSLDKPQYGAFATPLAVLFILFLLTTVLYVVAALAAGITDREVALHHLEPTSGQVVDRQRDG